MAGQHDWGWQPGSRLGLDIGGTLAKLVFFESERMPSWCNGTLTRAVKSLGSQSQESGDWGHRDDGLSFFDSQLKGTFHFVTFRSDQMAPFVQMLKDKGIGLRMKEIMTTGGGAYKYAKLFREELGVELKAVDELGVVVRGISWLLDRPIHLKEKLKHLECPSPSDTEASTRPGSVASSEGPMGSPSRAFEHGAAALFPFLLVNIGSGVSVVKVSGIDDFERVSGSAIGGGTFWGLCRLLVPECHSFEDAGHLAEEGEEASCLVNLTVKDIYGGDYELPNGSKLPGSTTASFFAKAASSGSRACSDAGKVQALMKMVSSNICQIAYLNARLHGLKRIVFTGNFLRQNSVARQAIAENMRRVSRAHPNTEPFKALFLEHEGYFGALGSFLFNVQEAEADEQRDRVPTARSQRRLSIGKRPAGASAGGADDEEEDAAEGAEGSTAVDQAITRRRSATARFLALWSRRQQGGCSADVGCGSVLGLCFPKLAAPPARKS